MTYDDVIMNRLKQDDIYECVVEMFKAKQAEIKRLRALLRRAKDRLYDTGCWDEADEIVSALGEKE